MGPGLTITLVGLVALAAERALFGPLAIQQQGPDLLLVGLLFYTPRCRALDAAGAGLILGLIRDLSTAVRPGTYTLTYLLAGLAVFELQAALRLPRGPAQAGLAGLMAFQVGLLAALLGWMVHPTMALGSVTLAVGIGALYTVVAAFPMLFLLEWIEAS